MSLEGGAVDQIKKLAQEAQTVQQIQIDGETYTDKMLHRVREKDDEPAAISIGTLQGVIDYVNESEDLKDEGQLYVIIENPTSIKIRSALFGKQQQRKCFAECKARGTSQENHVINEFMPVEQAIIMLKTYFVPNDDCVNIVNLISTISSDSSVEQSDDGMAQRVVVEEGLGRKGEAELPEVITLSPYRTFAEVEQPSSPYCVRAKKGRGVEVAFFASNSTQWMVEATQNVAKYLKENIKREDTIIIS